MNENEILERMRSDNFVKNNGVVLRAINIGRTNYNKLAQLRRALEPDISKPDFTDCINYLALEELIILRRCVDKLPADVADDDVDEIEAKLSSKGIRLLAGKISDDCVRA